MTKQAADWTNVPLFVSRSLSPLQKPPVTPRVPEITPLNTWLLAWFEVVTKRWLSPRRVNDKSGGLKCQWQLLSLHLGVWISCNGAASQSESNREDGPLRSPAWTLSYVELLENPTRTSVQPALQHCSMEFIFRACFHMRAATCKYTPSHPGERR